MLIEYNTNQQERQSDGVHLKPIFCNRKHQWQHTYFAIKMGELTEPPEYYQNIINFMNYYKHQLSFYLMSMSWTEPRTLTLYSLLINPTPPIKQSRLIMLVHKLSTIN